MRKGLIITLALMLTQGYALKVLAESPDPEMAKSRAASQEFMASLRKELARSLSQGGPAKAIGVCRERAPAISGEISEKFGLRIGRTSLRVRNPANAPDPWEEQVLNSFEIRKKAGEDPGKMEHAEILIEGDKKEFRYMKAIPTGDLCLSCHGSHLDQAVVSSLRTLYPHDRATGYVAGDIRGAVWVTIPLD